MSHENSNVKPSRSGRYLDADTWDALKAAGVSEEDLQADQPFGPMVFSYSRQQAIEDGVLVDVTELAERVGFRLHTVMTCGVVAEVTGGSQIEAFRQASILAVLQTLHQCIQNSDKQTDRLEFDVADWELWAHVGPGDDAEPVLTIMLIGED